MVPLRSFERAQLARARLHVDQVDIVPHNRQALARRDNSTALSARFKPLAKTLEENEAKIDAELIAAQGKPVDTGGYYLPEQAKTSAAMRPSATLNAALAAL